MFLLFMTMTIIIFTVIMNILMIMVAASGVPPRAGQTDGRAGCRHRPGGDLSAIRPREQATVVRQAGPPRQRHTPPPLLLLLVIDLLLGFLLHSNGECGANPGRQEGREASSEGCG